MPGVKGKSGRKKVISTLVNEALLAVDQQLPAIFTALIKRAADGDRDAQIYLIDRRLGKPKQQTDLELKGGKELGAGMVTKIMEIATQARREFIEGGNAIQIERTGQDVAQGSNEEAESNAEAKQ